MSNYNQGVFFGPKDTLTTGDPGKLIKGTEFDSEFAAVSVAIATKYDAGNIASNAQAAAFASDAVLLTPLKMSHALTNGTINLGTNVTSGGAAIVNVNRTITAGTGLAGGGSLATNRTISLSHLGLQNLTSPGADRILFWDQSEGVLTWLTASTGLTISGSGISVNPAAVNHDALQNYSVNRHIDHNGVSITAGGGLTGGGSIVASRSIALGTPGTLSTSTSNAVTTSSHTHAITGVEPTLAANRKRQVFVQSGTPSGQATGDLWIW